MKQEEAAKAEEPKKVKRTDPITVDFFSLMVSDFFSF